MPNKLTDKEIVKALEILDKLDFFGGQRAGRELWFDKSVDVQNKDIENFSKNIAFLKDLINRLQAENEDYKALYKGLKAEHLETIKAIKHCKTEAYKEFAEKLKKELFSPVETWLTSDVIREEDIDNTYKELVDDKK